MPNSFPDTAGMLAELAPCEPVYCLYPHVFSRIAREFVAGFPGRVLYAVKANNRPEILRWLHEAGVHHFDTASIPEIALVREVCPGAECYFMAPVRLRGAAGRAYSEYAVRHFVVDHEDELENILRETQSSDLTIFVRMAAHDRDATYDLSTKFGASPEDASALLRAVREAGATAALAFNVGSLVLKPGAYARALGACAKVLESAGVDIRLLDIGGGFPSPYPGVGTARLEEFFAAIAEAREALPLPEGAQLLGEPGRALVAEGVSVVAQVLLRKPGRLYLNDGIWGSFIEPFLSKGLVRYPTRTYRGGELLEEELAPFTLYGPTCDSLDTFPAPFSLPHSIRAGDWVEFGMLGAYSVTNRTGFNGFYPDHFVTIDNPMAFPPAP